MSLDELICALRAEETELIKSGMLKEDNKASKSVAFISTIVESAIGFDKKVENSSVNAGNSGSGVQIGSLGCGS